MREQSGDEDHVGVSPDLADYPKIGKTDGVIAGLTQSRLERLAGHQPDESMDPLSPNSVKFLSKHSLIKFSASGEEPPHRPLSPTANARKFNDDSSDNTRSMDDDEWSMTASHTNSMCSTSSRTRRNKRHKRIKLKLMSTLGSVMSSSMQVVIDNAGAIATYYAIQQPPLGAGSFGSVSRAVVKATGATRAVKAISTDRMKEHIGVIKREIDIAREVDHPNLIKLYEIFEDDVHIYLVMELCTGGHLLDRVENALGRALPEAQAAIVMCGVFRAVFYLHNNLICHRDLKPENVLLTTAEPPGQSNVKVSDFGASMKVSKKGVMKTRSGTCLYMAPEVLARSYNHSCDMWSCGVVMYFILSGDLPFGGENEVQIGRSISRGSYSYKPARWNHVSQTARDLIGSLLQKNPKARYSVEQALNHDWITDLVVREEREHVKLTMRHIQKLREFRKLNKFKRAALNVIVSMLPEEQIRESRELFVMLDVNGDGALSIAELKRMVRRCTIRRRLSSNDVTEIFLDSNSGSTSSTMFHRADSSIDNALVDFAYTEFLAATFDWNHAVKDEVCWAAFKAFDKRGSNRLSMAELATGRILGVLSMEELSKTLDEVDKDGNGYIDYDEFKVMVLEAVEFESAVE